MNRHQHTTMIDFHLAMSDDVPVIDEEFDEFDVVEVQDVITHQ